VVCLLVALRHASLVGADYDCHDMISMLDWCEEQRTWCCHFQGIGCPMSTPTATVSTIATRTSLPYDCKRGTEEQWSNSKAAWCCARFGRNCPVLTTTKAGAPATTKDHAPATIPASAPVVLSPTTSPAFACDVARPAWPAQEVAWCCANRHIGCPASPVPSEGCDTLCDVGGELASCRSRIRWASLNEFTWELDACTQAHLEVLRECPVCGICSLAAAGCAARPPTTAVPVTTPVPFDCLAGLAVWAEVWTAPKQSWCCNYRHLGCPTTPRLSTTSTSTSSTSMPTILVTTSSAPYDCVTGFSDFERAWSAGRKAWCCIHAHRACPVTSFVETSVAPRLLSTVQPYDCNDVLPLMQWCEQQRKWCCERQGVGCPTTNAGYDCNAGYDRWQKGWSAQKRSWCCLHTERGCTIEQLQGKTAPVLPPQLPPGPTLQPSHLVVHADPYDCEAKTGRSEQEDVWCCENRKLHCNYSGPSIFRRKFGDERNLEWRLGTGGFFALCISAGGTILAASAAAVRRYRRRTSAPHDGTRRSCCGAQWRRIYTPLSLLDQEELPETMAE